MKKIVLAILMFTFSLSAAQINSGSYNPATDTVTLDVSYSGGCEEHVFSLDFDGLCLESFPMQTSATLIDSTVDRCELWVTDTVEVPVTGIPCSPAYLTIKGDNKTSVRVFVTK